MANKQLSNHIKYYIKIAFPFRCVLDKDLVAFCLSPCLLVSILVN